MCAAQHRTIERSAGAKTCVSRLKRAEPCAHHQSLVLHPKSATGETGPANGLFLKKTMRGARFATVIQRVEGARRCLRHETSGAAGHARKDCQNRLSLGRQGIGGRWHIPCENRPTGNRRGTHGSHSSRSEDHQKWQPRRTAGRNPTICCRDLVLRQQIRRDDKSLSTYRGAGTCAEASKAMISRGGLSMKTDTWMRHLPCRNAGAVVASRSAIHCASRLHPVRFPHAPTSQTASRFARVHPRASGRSALRPSHH